MCLVPIGAIRKVRVVPLKTRAIIPSYRSVTTMRWHTPNGWASVCPQRPNGSTQRVAAWNKPPMCGATSSRSEEHTSELQSLMRISYAVFCLKKKKNQTHKENRVSIHQTAHNNTHDN